MGTWELAKWLVHWTVALASRIPRIETVFALRRRVLKLIASVIRYQIIRLVVLQSLL